MRSGHFVRDLDFSIDAVVALLRHVAEDVLNLFDLRFDDP
jgi:hypothetical protein